MKEQKILVPLDRSSLSAQTVKTLIAMKKSLNLSPTLLHVLDLSQLSYRGFAQLSFDEIEDQAREQARQFVAEKQAEFAAAGVEAVTLVKEGHIRETIGELADSGDYDLLVIGKHSEGDLRHPLFGRFANHLVHHVKCPVLIV